MGKSFVVSGRGFQSGVNDNLTRFFPLVGSATPNATEVQTEMPVRVAGAFSNFLVKVVANTASVTSTVTLRQSQADTPLLHSITSDQTGTFTDTDSVAFAATDEVDIEVTVPTEVGTNTITFGMFAAQFTPDTSTNTVTFWGFVTGGVSFSTASATTFFGLTGVNSSATEANRQYKTKFPFTASNLYSYVGANARTTDTSFSTRKNTTAGAQIVTYTSGQTGAKEDITNTDSLVVDDLYGLAITTNTGTGSITYYALGVTAVNTADQFGFQNPGQTQNFNETIYYPIRGTSDSTQTTEANVDVYPPFTFNLGEFHTYVSANSIATSDTTITVRENQADSALAITYSETQTGLKNDSADILVITASTDDVCVQIATPNTSGTITLDNFGLMGSVTGVSPSSSASVSQSPSASLSPSASSSASQSPSASLSPSTSKSASQSPSASLSPSSSSSASQSPSASLSPSSSSSASQSPSASLSPSSSESASQSPSASLSPSSSSSASQSPSASLSPSASSSASLSPSASQSPSASLSPSASPSNESASLSPSSSSSASLSPSSSSSASLSPSASTSLSLSPSSSVSPSASSSGVKVWDGVAWVEKPLYVWDGNNWI